MKTRINYNPTWDNEGYHITQNVTLECTEVELAYINSRVHSLMERHGDGWLYSKMRTGAQRVGLTMLKEFKEVVGKDNKRLKDDRNTIVNVCVTKTRQRNREGECVTCGHANAELTRCTLHNIPIYQPSMGCNEWGRG